jgi:hypothetical protein
MPVSARPPGYHSVTPYLAVDGAARAIDFYIKVFDARERMRFDAPGGKIGHAEIEIGNALVMLADPWPEGHFVAPKGKEVWSASIFTSRMGMVLLRAPSRPEQRWCSPWKRSFMATGAAPCAIPSVMCGISRPMSKTSRPRK